MTVAYLRCGTLFTLDHEWDYVNEAWDDGADIRPLYWVVDANT